MVHNKKHETKVLRRRLNKLIKQAARTDQSVRRLKKGLPELHRRSERVKRLLDQVKL